MLDKLEQCVGKTIKGFQYYGPKGNDDIDVLQLTFTDGTIAYLGSWYGVYTGDSVEEYPCFLGIVSMEGAVYEKRVY